MGISFFFAFPSAEAGKPRCFLSGVMVPKSKKDDSNLGNQIRLSFDADERAKCEQMISAYCTYNVVGENYLPTRLQSYFKPDEEKDEKINFVLTDKCKISSAD